MIKGFKLNENGDVVFKDKRIQMVEGDELLRQKVSTVLGTNKGEWVLNRDEGINFRNIIGKRTPEETQDNTAIKSYYEGEITAIKEDNATIAKRLEDRLEGII